MKTINKIEANVDELELMVMEGEQIEIVDELEEGEATKLLKCSPETMDTLLMLVADIKQLIGDDLKDIWERLDKLGIDEE